MWGRHPCRSPPSILVTPFAVSGLKRAVLSNATNAPHPSHSSPIIFSLRRTVLSCHIKLLTKHRNVVEPQADGPGRLMCPRYCEYHVAGVRSADFPMSAIEQVQIPEKLFYRINEVATITQVKPYVLRYWETEFPTLAPEKDDNDQRRYRKADIEVVLQIKRLLYEEKFTISGARKQLKEMGANHTPVTQVRSSASPAPVKVDLDRFQRISSSLGDLRRDLTELYRLLSQ